MSTTTRRARTDATPISPADTGDWRDDAECRNVDPELFFPVGITPLAMRQASEAKTICERCHVRNTCLDWAVSSGQVTGIWGGLTEDERVGMARIQGNTAWAWCLDQQHVIEVRRAQGVTVRALAAEMGVAYEFMRKVLVYLDSERNTLAAVGGEES